jgi:hypothetical protein
LLEIRKWGSHKKNKMDNIDEWAALWWANKKTKEYSPFIAMNKLR